MKNLFKEIREVAGHALQENLNLRCISLYIGDIWLAWFTTVTWAQVYELVLHSVVTVITTVIAGTLVYVFQRTLGDVIVARIQKYFGKDKEK